MLSDNWNQILSCLQHISCVMALLLQGSLQNPCWNCKDHSYRKFVLDFGGSGGIQNKVWTHITRCGTDLIAPKTKNFNAQYVFDVLGSRVGTQPSFTPPLFQSTLSFWCQYVTICPNQLRINTGIVTASADLFRCGLKSTAF